MEMKRRRAMFAKDGTLGRVFLLSVNLTPFMHVSSYLVLRACARFVLRFKSKMEGNGDEKRPILAIDDTSFFQLFSHTEFSLFCAHDYVRSQATMNGVLNRCLVLVE